MPVVSWTASLRISAFTLTGCLIPTLQKGTFVDTLAFTSTIHFTPVMIGTAREHKWALALTVDTAEHFSSWATQWYLATEALTLSIGEYWNKF